MAPQSVPRRRQRELNSDDDSDGSAAHDAKRQASPAAWLARRAPASTNESPAESLSPVPRDSSQQHAPGAIVRVKMHKFVTYDDVEFLPGPNLNMVIGPNGTGKSSLVCAICLGLGYSPIHLGRSDTLGDFVKHGSEDAVIEIELQRQPGENGNPVVKLRIIREGNKRKWWINGAETSLKAVQTLTRRFGIQIDNLCQFLPQDRVAEFAGLSPVALLHETQRAAAPEEMLEWHDKLGKLYAERKDEQQKQENGQEVLTDLQARQATLQGDVERLRERQEVQQNILLKEKTLPFIEYQSARRKTAAAKDRAKAAKLKYKRLEEELQPALEAVNNKQDYSKQVGAVLQERKKVLDGSVRAADTLVGSLEAKEEAVNQVDKEVAAEREGQKKRTNDLRDIRKKIRDLEARAQDQPPEFNAPEWNARIRVKEHAIRDRDRKNQDLKEQGARLFQQGKEKKREVNAAFQELKQFDSQEGQQTIKLEKVSSQTAKAWDWVKKHMDQFEKTVYGPPLVECRVTDPRYSNVVEATVGRGQMISLVCQTKADFKKLSDTFHDQMNLNDVFINSVEDPVPTKSRLVSDQQLKDLGFDGWAIDYLDGPEPVLAYLEDLSRCAVGLNRLSDEQFERLRSTPISRSFAGDQSYQISWRREYGPNATSTVIKDVWGARWWTADSADLPAKAEVERKLERLSAELQTLKAEIAAIQQRLEELDGTQLEEEVQQLKDRKNDLQKAWSGYQMLPNKIDREKENLRDKETAIADYQRRMEEFKEKKERLVLERMELALEYTAAVAEIRTHHGEVVEAEIRFLEAKSDVDALSARNSETKQQLEDEKRKAADADKEHQTYKSVAANVLRTVQSILAEADEEEERYFTNIDPGLDYDTVQQELEAERAKLEFMHASNPHAIEQYEKREGEIRTLQENLAKGKDTLEKIDSEIGEIRGKWEPRLDTLIQEISDAFSFNFSQIGCAGEVSIHKDENFEHWSVQIRVKFRETDTLQILNAQRQSGGERSVSTIFYLMALQALARAPFRVVDEINQGMDARNERMVHERMVEIACDEHTSQYFLITPKLLTSLRYDRRMKILCIASGEHMPRDYRSLDLRSVVNIKRALIAGVR